MDQHARESLEGLVAPVALQIPSLVALLMLQVKNSQRHL
jgi:hypothetical protein